MRAQGSDDHGAPSTEGILMGTDGHVVRGTDVKHVPRSKSHVVRLLDGAEYGFGDVSIIITEDPRRDRWCSPEASAPTHLYARVYRGPRSLHDW